MDVSRILKIKLSHHEGAEVIHVGTVVYSGVVHVVVALVNSISIIDTAGPIFQISFGFNGRAGCHFPELNSVLVLTVDTEVVTGVKKL